MNSDIIKTIIIIGLGVFLLSAVYSAVFRCGDMCYGDVDNPPCDTNSSYFNQTGPWNWIAGDTFNLTLNIGTYTSTDKLRILKMAGNFYGFYPTSTATSYIYYAHDWESSLSGARIETFYTITQPYIVNQTDEYITYAHHMYNYTGLRPIREAWLYTQINRGANTIKEWWEITCEEGYAQEVYVRYSLIQHSNYRAGIHWCPGHYGPEQWTAGSRICNTTFMDRRFVALWNNSDTGSNNLLLMTSWDSNDTAPGTFGNYGTTISWNGIYLVRPTWYYRCSGSLENHTFPALYHKGHYIAGYDSTDSDEDGVPDMIMALIDEYYPQQHACGDDGVADTFYNGTLAGTSHFCYEGNYLNQQIDANETLCSYYGYDWFSDSNIPGTYTFTNDNEGDEPSGWDVWYNNGVVEVVDEVDGHSKVVEIST
ncbi:MAG: hypothetical protein PHW96_03570, partial [Candidatus Nanoarchaeia archaeon]|nr:hypothetical protein [Candidatus Nanoarchaeia archaeon]